MEGGRRYALLDKQWPLKALLADRAPAAFPAKAGIQMMDNRPGQTVWVPAFAGKVEWGWDLALRVWLMAANQKPSEGSFGSWKNYRPTEDKSVRPRLRPW